MSSSHSWNSRVFSSANQKVSYLKRIKSAIKGKACPICLNRVEDSTAAVLTVCTHVYCIDCIRKWSKLKRNCPLCNAVYDSWFLKTRFSTADFKEERLPPDLHDRKKKKVIDSTEDYRAEIDRFSSHRIVRRRSRNELVRANRNQESRPLPWRRSFGRLRFASKDERQKHQAEVAERALQWRASIYSKRLQAVPLPSKYCLQQKILANKDVEEKMRQQLEPWIQRELQVILGDSDPSVIVHLCTCLYMSSLEEKHRAPSECLSINNKYVEQLKPFLYERSNMFWHELSCFAGSMFDMTTYDSVVEYKQMELLKKLPHHSSCSDF